VWNLSSAAIDFGLLRENVGHWADEEAGISKQNIIATGRGSCSLNHFLEGLLSLIAVTRLYPFGDRVLGELVR
jgi:hypothetical protein